LTVEGRATIDGKEVRRPALHPLLPNPTASTPGPIPMLTSLAVALTGAEAFAVRGPDRIEVVAGYPVDLPVSVARSMGLAGPVTVDGQFLNAAAQGRPATNLAIAPVAAPADRADLKLTVPATTPEGTYDIAVRGRARVGNADRTLFGPVVAVVVHRPFAVQAPPSLVLVPGQPAVLAGKLARRPPFKEAVQLKLDGLPRGVDLATPLTPASGDEFRIELKVDANAVTTAASLTLTASAAINGATFVHPPVMVSVEFKK
jgi:hypothetical protein